MNTKIVTMLVLFLLLFSVHANRVVVENYGMSNQINAMVFGEDGTLWLATPGGLVHHDYDNSKIISIFHNPDDFPDINLTSLTFDSEGYLWIGTESGILYRRDKSGNQEAFHDLELVDATINTMLYYNGLLFIGHRQGISIFEIKSLSYRATAEQFGNLSNKPIVDLKIKDDTLYAVYNNSQSDVLQFTDVSKSALTIAFSTPARWKVVSIAKDPDNRPLINSIQFDSKRGILGFPHLSLVDNEEYVYNRDSTLIRGYYSIDTIDNGTGPVVVDSFHVTAEKTLSKLVSIQIRNSGEVVSGHELESYYKYPFKGEGRTYFPGLRKGDLQKLFLQNDGTLWTIPNVQTTGGKLVGKNELIALKDGEYRYYGDWNTGFGTMGKSDLFTAVAEGPDGAMWFGNSGDFVKRFRKGKWQRLIHDKKEPYVEKPFWVSDNRDYDVLGYGFPKIEGLFVDDNNILWSTMWHNNGVDGRPMFYVYNVETEEHRYVGVTTRAEMSPYYLVEGAFKNKLFTFRWHRTIGDYYYLLNGDLDIFDTTLSLDSYILNKETLSGKILDVAVSDTGSYVFATDAGVEARYYHQAERIPRGDRESNVYAKAVVVGQAYTLNETADAGADSGVIKSVIQTDLWVGVKDSGVALYYLKEYWNPDTANTMDSIKITKDSAFSMIFQKERLIAMDPISMVYDKESNHLWVASSKGLSRVYMQRNTIPYDDNKEFYLFPNPYRKSEHSEVTLKNVAKDAYVDIYTSSGQLVEHLTRKESFFVEEDDRGIYYYKWSPSSKLAPGTYFVIAKNENRSSVVLQKLLILP